MIEIFDHTADLGLRVRAADLDTLFAEAARALFSAIVEDLGTVVASQRLEDPRRRDRPRIPAVRLAARRCCTTSTRSTCCSRRFEVAGRRRRA